MMVVQDLTILIRQLHFRNECELGIVFHKEHILKTIGGKILAIFFTFRM